MITRILLALAFSAAAPKKTLPTPGYISPELRKVLDKRMESHGRAAMGLSIAVILLEHDEVAELALQIADAPGLARTNDKDTLNATLPPAFFKLQDRLRERARELAKVAGTKDNQKMHAAYARVTETCMSCHTVFLKGPGSEADPW